MCPAVSAEMPSWRASFITRNQPTIIEIPSITPYEWMGTGSQGREKTSGVGIQAPPRKPIRKKAATSRSRGVELRGALGSFRRCAVS